MIRAVQQVSLPIQTDATLRMMALQKAYGGTAALRLYQDENGSVAAVCDGQMYLERVAADAEEWVLFAAMDPMIRRLRTDVQTAQLYARKVGGTFEQQAVMQPINLQVKSETPTQQDATAQQLWQLLRAGFGDAAPAYDAFYADVLHRMRHGCFEQRVVKGDNGLLACAMTVAYCDDAAMIGAVATHPDARRKGYASACVTQLAASLQAQGKAVYLCPKNPYAERLYLSLGFEIKGQCGIATAP